MSLRRREVGTLSDVVAPPYDVIDPALQDRLYQASEHNVIRLELNREEPGDTAAQGRYARAARFLQGLAAAGHSPRGGPRRALRLRADLRGRGDEAHAPGASWPGCGWSRSARGRSTRTSRPSPGPRPTGWPCINATGFNLSPIFGLYPDADGDVLRTLEAGLRDRTPLVATDHLGVENRLWVVEDQETHTADPRPDGRQARLHRRRPSPLRDRPEIPRRAGTSRRARPATTTRPISA